MAVTSMGVTPESHATIPLALKPLYNGLLPAIHADKLGMERLLSHCGGLPWLSKNEPNKEILPDGWQSAPGLPAQGDLKHVVVIRPCRLVGIGEGIEITLQSIAKAEVVEGYGGKLTTSRDYLSPRIHVLGKYCGL